jgi:hypothetical protein
MKIIQNYLESFNNSGEEGWNHYSLKMVDTI